MTPSEAKRIITALANGIDPDTGEAVQASTSLNKPHVIRALWLAANALGTTQSLHFSDARTTSPKRLGLAWTADEDQRLLAAFESGTDVHNLATLHGRSVGAVRSRLMKHGRHPELPAGTDTGLAPPSSTRSIEFRGITLNVDWTLEDAVHASRLPACPGIYAEIHWPKRGVRIGETGVSIRRKIYHDLGWFKSMHDGTAPQEQLRRTIPIAMTAKEHGAAGFAFYVVSVDPRLKDKSLRQDCERHMFAWLEGHPNYHSWNHQKSWR
jgi:hypothetical protein